MSNRHGEKLSYKDRLNIMMSARDAQEEYFQMEVDDLRKLVEDKKISGTRKRIAEEIILQKTMNLEAEES